VKYGFTDAKAVNIPADPNLILSWHMDPETDKTDNFPFQEAIGSLNFAQTGTRPDISYALSAAGQFAKKPLLTVLQFTRCFVTSKVLPTS
jgi:hypothetical protein